jgi:hypothetical protein
VILAFILLILRLWVVLKTSVASMTSPDMIKLKSNLTEEIQVSRRASDRGSYAKPLFVRALSSHSRVCESELSSWNNFFQSCRQGSNRGPSDKKATAKSTPPRGTHWACILFFLS